jgi:predicted CxxxxCH...CXXCH cytochrome family protein
VNGQLPTVPFGLIALTGGASPVLNFTNLTCSATYCHGNFTGGVGASNSVSWGASNLACNSCHGIPPPTGRHDKHVNGESIACATCHGTGYGSSTITGGALPLHVDGVKTIASGTPPGWDPTTRRCSNSCHGASQGTW